MWTTKCTIVWILIVNLFSLTPPAPSDKYTKVADGLVVKKVSKNDSGEYTCKAFQSSTSISNFKEQTIRLNIQRKFLAKIIYQTIGSQLKIQLHFGN